MKLRKWLRNKALQHLRRQRQDTYPGFEQCKKVALFFTVGQPADAKLLQLKARLEEEGTEVSLLCFFPYKKKEQAADFQFKNYAANEVNWLGKPSSPVFYEWVSHTYDAFIDLNTSPQKSFEFVRAMINAKLCIGFNAAKAPWADVSLKFDPQKDFERASDEIIKYLKFINKAS